MVNDNQGRDLHVHPEELVNAWLTMADALRLYEESGDELALLIALRQGEHILLTVAQDDGLWARVEELLSLGVTEAEQLVEDLDQLLTEEHDILVRAGIPAARARQLLDGARVTIQRYLELRERGEAFAVGQLRERMYDLSREVSSARAELERRISDSIERTPVPRERRGTRYFRLAVRTLLVAGGVTEIVIDVAAAHATLGVTLLSVLHGAAEIGEGLAPRD